MGCPTSRRCGASSSGEAAPQCSMWDEGVRSACDENGASPAHCGRCRGRRKADCRVARVNDSIIRRAIPVAREAVSPPLSEDHAAFLCVAQ
ncbi:hypothetical protein F8B43_3578 [Methylorubrum populi]|uniref:Uncharacterized protein n=1 Tax=Methylorubrum populi TaxID=223967 RepID=A0A833J357_9HYPH|nr:hypothetical protein F8B43_3578 [Methylorubrum populi]